MTTTTDRMDTTPGSVSAAQIVAIHRAAARRVVKGEDLHEVVRFMAWDRFEVESLKDLSKQQASELLVTMGVKPPKPYVKRRTHGPAPGVIKLKPRWHPDYIRRLATDLGMSSRDLVTWLQTRFQVNRPEDLQTAARSGRAIQALKLKIEACTPTWSDGK